MATMSKNERIVRAAWIAPRIQSVGTHSFVYLSQWDRTEEYPYPQSRLWAIAAEFTLKRQQEIADVKYEISLQRLVLYNHESQEWRNPLDWETDKAALERTITRLQSALTELTRGWKEESHGN